MSRPLRLEFAGALYHVTSRGNEKKPIYLDDADFELFLLLMAEVCQRFNWVIHAYCLMTNRKRPALPSTSYSVLMIQ
ncbi:MAG: hypothetical protein Q7U57_10040 [Methylovulum sp.]|nr:hypothetical protein [Methylovulum sp.]